MEKIKQAANYYDSVYESGGYGGVYELPYRHSSYFPLFRGMLAALRRKRATSVLEVGCGNGAFAHLLKDKTDVSYSGFDFSHVAVEKARLRTGRPDWFFVGDALSAESYRRPHDAIVCGEVLEHIEDDLGVIRNWGPGVSCICSVPNFDAESHVRFFRNESEVVARYSTLLNIERVVRIRKPVLPDISWGSYARALRWYRYRPARLLAVLGIGSFESLGGWFLFSGTRK
jgi:SAM-dependent methyltransferase